MVSYFGRITETKTAKRRLVYIGNHRLWIRLVYGSLFSGTTGCSGPKKSGFVGGIKSKVFFFANESLNFTCVLSLLQENFICIMARSIVYVEHAEYGDVAKWYNDTQC